LNQTLFPKPKTARADGYCISAHGVKNGTGVAVQTATCQLSSQRTPVSGPRRETKDFGMEAAPISPPSYCPEVVMPGVCRL